MTTPIAFTRESVHATLQRDSANPEIEPDLNSYRLFFRSQPQGDIGPAGFIRALQSPQEVDLLLLMLDFSTRDTFSLYAGRMEYLAQARDRAGIEIYTPLRQVSEVMVAYRLQLEKLKLNTWQRDLAEEYYLQKTLPVAAHVTATAFRDIALHQVLGLAGGDVEASEAALQSGGSFTALRELYGVELTTTSSNLNSWRIGLWEELHSVAEKAAALSWAQRMDRLGRD